MDPFIPFTRHQRSDRYPMFKVIIYLFPILINCLGGGMFYITANRLSEAHADKFLVSATCATWALPYFVVSLLCGKFITEKRAVPVIITASFMLMVFSLGFIAVPNVYVQFLWIFLYGVAMALYCTPFQVFMKKIGGGNSGVVYSTAMYTWAWSFGYAFGPFIFGLFTWKTGFYFNAAIALFLAILVIATNAWLNRHPQNQATDGGHQREDLYRGRPDLAWLGWLGLVFGCTTICVVRTLLQDLLVLDVKVDRFHPATMITILSAIQGFFALSLIRTKTWMYRPLPNILAGLAGIVSLFLMGTANTLPVFYLASALYGLYSGYFFFMLVFHSLVHPTKSGKYVGINEAVVGIVSILASAGCGIFAKHFSVRTTFLACAALVILATLIQAPILARKHRKD